MDILFKSLAAAGVTACILLLEKSVGPRIAGAMGGIPIVFAISFILVTMSAKNSIQIHDFLVGGIIGAIAGVVFCLVLLYLNTHFLQHYWLNFIGAYVLCFLFALGATQVFQK